MKYLKVRVTKTLSTDLYVEVSDDFEAGSIMHSQFLPKLGRIALETTDSSDWDALDWERSVRAVGAVEVPKDEAEQYNIGTLRV